MAELVERNCHAPGGGHAAEWSLHDDGTWEATYGPHSESGQAKNVNEARKAAEAWVGTVHKVHTGQALPS